MTMTSLLVALSVLGALVFSAMMVVALVEALDAYGQWRYIRSKSLTVYGRIISLSSCERM